MLLIVVCDQREVVLTVLELLPIAEFRSLLPGVADIEELVAVDALKLPLACNGKYSHNIRAAQFSPDAMNIHLPARGGGPAAETVKPTAADNSIPSYSCSSTPTYQPRLTVVSTKFSCLYSGEKH